MSNQKKFVGDYKDKQESVKNLFQLSVCNDYARHPKITNRYGKFVVFKMLVLKHYGMDFLTEDETFWYFKR